MEHQNRTLLKAIKIAHVEEKNWKTEINKFLMAYRSNPQVSVGASLYHLIFGREMRTKLPELDREPQLFDEEIRDEEIRETVGKHVLFRYHLTWRRKACFFSLPFDLT